MPSLRELAAIDEWHGIMPSRVGYTINQAKFRGKPARSLAVRHRQHSTAAEARHFGLQRSRATTFACLKDALPPLAYRSDLRPLENV